jgi:hypothetical protein
MTPRSQISRLGVCLVVLSAATVWPAQFAAHAAPTPNGAPTGSVTGTNSVDACLPFSMPATDALFNSPKKVFAHYFYPFPLSVSNKSPDQDYYNVNYLNKNGESNKWLAQGGFLRQRPLPVNANSDPNWRLLNMETEVKWAIARGITGFTIDIMSSKQASDPNSPLHMLLTAAQAVDSRFKIVVMPDLQVLRNDPDGVAQIIASVASSPAAYRLADGRLVVTAFNAGANPPEWWKAIFDQLQSQGIKVAFVPTFLGWDGKADAFSTISYGFSDWGTATAKASDNMKTAPGVAHGKYGKTYMMPVDPQQYRPKDSILVEADNSLTFRNAWMSAITGGADWVQLVTWSDFSESSEVEPYTDSTLRRDIGTGYYDLNAYYASWFLLGNQPAITHDVLYYFYRREPTTAAGPAQSKPVRIPAGAASDEIELLAFLTEPGILKIKIGSQDYVQSAPAGMTSFKVAMQPGFPVFSLSRGGSEVFSFQGPVQIFDQSGTPSGVLDMTYWSGSASRSGVCSL